jgi:amino acid transporter
MTAGEAKDPWNDLPAVTRLIYCIPLTVYPILALLVGFTVNYADPQLYRMWAADNQSGSHSPFLIAIKSSTSLAPLATPINTFFLLTAYTCGNTALYVGSRIFFYNCQEYGTPWMRDYFATTNSGGTPQRAIWFSSLWGLFGLLGVWDRSWNTPVLFMAAFFTGSVGCVYVCQCWTFLRFRKG